ncbi:MAG: hypothetical protein JST80_11175 [Bdellovibrionales bacterium]|nr:hypothetical protein [Bdellovibrionales bacterium]
MKNAYFLVLAATSLVSVTAFAGREVKCQAVKIEKEMGNIKTINFTVANHGASKASISHIGENNAVETREYQGGLFQSWSDEDELYWYNSTDLGTIDGAWVTSEVTLVKKERSKAAKATWVLRKILRKKYGGSGCIVDEDFGCAEKTELAGESAMICSDSADIPSKPSIATQDAIDSDPCNPKN